MPRAIEKIDNHRQSRSKTLRMANPKPLVAANKMIALNQKLESIRALYERSIRKECETRADFKQFLRMLVYNEVDLPPNVEKSLLRLMNKYRPNEFDDVQL